MIKKKHVLFFCTFLLLMFAQSSNLYAQKIPKNLKWTTFDKLSSKKMTVVLLYTVWDVSFNRMERMALSDPKIVKYGNKKLNFVRFDIEHKKPITYQGVTYHFDAKDGNRGRHELAKKLCNGEHSIPVVVILNEEQEITQAIPNYIETKDFDAIIHYYAEDTYKKQPWEEFEKTLNLKKEDNDNGVD